MILYSTAVIFLNSIAGGSAMPRQDHADGQLHFVDRPCYLALHKIAEWVS